MSAPYRTAYTQFGPRNGSGWTEPLGVAITLPATTGEYAVYTVPPISLNTVGGRVLDVLGVDNVIENLSQVLMAYTAAVAGSLAGLAVTFNLRRAGLVVGGGGFAGWVAGASPAFAAWVPQAVPFLPANTQLRKVNSTTPVSATRAILPLQPLDVITVSLTIPGGFTTTSFVSLDGI